MLFLSTRYVFNKYGLKTVYSSKKDNRSEISVLDISKIIFCNSEPSIDESAGIYKPRGSEIVFQQSDFSDINNQGIRTSDYQYAILCGTSSDNGGKAYCEADFVGTLYRWRVVRNYLGYSESGATSTKIMHRYTIETSAGKGTLLDKTSGPSQSTYPADGVSGNYWYTYLGSDNIDPTAVGYSTTTPKGGENITIRVTARSNTYGGTISYRYQYSINGGQSWTDAGTTTATSKTVTVPKGAPTFQARVLASDNMGFTSSTWVTGAKLTVTNNTAPTISGTDGDLGTFALTPPQAVSYTINDADGNTVAVTVTLDGATVASFNATLGQANSYSIPGDRWLETLNGKHTIKITANDGQGGSAVRTYTFTKNVTTMSVQLAQPLPADAMITKAAETILASLPAGTKTKVEICNNGFDAAPTWEDVTVRALAGEKLFLANTKNTAGKWGYNIRVTVERGTAQGEVSLTSIAGFFE